MSTRPVSLAAAAALTALIGASMALVGAFLLAIAGGVIGLLAADDAATPVTAMLGLVGITAGLLTSVATVGLWQGRAWGWAGSLAIVTFGLLGGIAALTSSGVQGPVVAGTALALAALGLLLAPRTRAAAGVA